MLINEANHFLLILIGICLGSIAFLTSIGNLFVLFAFYYDKKLRTINDYFIMNMAIADFLVGSFCIPFYIPYCLKQIWPFGKIFCKIWVTIDDVSTMASVINILAISINRYWSIAYPISYRKYIKQHFVYLVMILIWLISLLNFAPGIWLINLFNKDQGESVFHCSGDYNKSFVYMLIAQLNYFIFPFVLLCILNLLIMFNIWKRTRKMKRLRTIQILKRFDYRTSFVEQYSPIVSTRISIRRKSICQNYQRKTSTNIFSIEDSLRTSKDLNGNSNRFVKTYKNNLRFDRDKKAARSLFILVLVFLIFLFPYVICSVATTAGFRISPIISEISFWLLWMNSTFNPFLYPFIQTKYRRAYCKLFKSFFKPSN